MTDSPKSKRKNDDKAKGLPRNRLTVVMGLLTLAAVMIVAGLITRTRLVPTGPTGHLLYSGGQGYSVDLATGERTVITDPIPQSPAHDVMVLSPDGQWRYTAQAPEGKNDYSAAELWRINTRTQDKERLTDNTFAEMWPIVSPDGSKIAYVATPDGYRRLYIMDLVTREVTLLTPDFFVYWPAWSPDGQWIAFPTDHTGSFDIWIVRIDGSEMQPIAITSEHETDPFWLP